MRKELHHDAGLWEAGKAQKLTERGRRGLGSGLVKCQYYYPVLGFRKAGGARGNRRKEVRGLGNEETEEARKKRKRGREEERKRGSNDVIRLGQNFQVFNLQILLLYYPVRHSNKILLFHTCTMLGWCSWRMAVSSFAKSSEFSSM